MANTDHKAALPIRTEGDLEEKVQIKIVDFADPEGTDKQVEVSEKLAHIRNFGADSDGVKVQQLLSQEGHALTRGDYDAANNKRPSSQGVIVSSRSASPAETTMDQRPTAVAGDNNKTAMDVAISDSDGNHFTDDNPLPVYMADDPGLELHDHHEAADIAKDAVDSTSIAYTVVDGTALKLSQVILDASGKYKAELLIGDGGAPETFTRKAVTFGELSKRGDIEFKKPLSIVASGADRTVKVTITNRDNATQSVYGTFIGIVE